MQPSVNEEAILETALRDPLVPPPRQWAFEDQGVKFATCTAFARSGVPRLGGLTMKCHMLGLSAELPPLYACEENVTTTLLEVSLKLRHRRHIAHVINAFSYSLLSE